MYIYSYISKLYTIHQKYNWDPLLDRNSQLGNLYTKLYTRVRRKTVQSEITGANTWISELSLIVWSEDDSQQRVPDGLQ